MNKAIPFLLLLFLAGCGGYKVENGQWSYVVYDEGSGRKVMPLNGADMASFVPINGEYARDDRNVYWKDSVIPGADPSSFVCLGGGYAKDQHKVFKNAQEIKQADPESFKLLGGLWSRDQKDFYLGATALGVQDPDSFRKINQGWAKDDRAYYVLRGFLRNPRKVDCDYPTMKILNEGYAVDKNRAYFGGSPMTNVDLMTFHATSDITARDQFRKYRTNVEDWF